MRLDVTPLGATRRSAAVVARAVVDYLEGPGAAPGPALLAGGASGGVAAYYGDSPEGPGRWVGAGAAYHGLEGTVERDALKRMLEGRHPVTGARLVTARGSSQRGHLAVGAAARFDDNGDALYGIADAARLLGVARRDVEEMISSWHPGTSPADRRALRSVSVDGATYVPDAEIGRHLELAADPPGAAEVLAGSDPDERLTVARAAELLGVTVQYVRRLCARNTPDGSDGDEQPTGRLSATKTGRRGSWQIRRGDLAAFAAQRQPPVARVGYDVTLTVEKSFGVVMMLAEPTIQRRFVAALDVANTTALAHLDRHAAVARRRGHVVGTEGLVAASYFHATSRALDPHPHRHNVIANAVVDDQGAIRTLDARALYRHAPTAAALATAAARWELRDLGLGWWQRDDGIWELAGVDEATIDQFSSRRHDIAEIRQALERHLGRPVTVAEDRKIWADTRSDKTAVDPAELLASWRDRADRVGFCVERCFDRADRALVYETLPPDRVAHLLAHLADPDRGVCAAVDRFDRGDVIRAIADWSLIDLNGVERKVLLPPAEIEALAGRFLTSEHVVALDPALGRGVIRRRDGQLVDDGQVQRCHSTVEMLRTQQRVIDLWRQGRATGCGLVDPGTVDAVLAASGATLSDEQQTLVRTWCTSGDRAQGAIGRAGTGKTATMGVAADCWRAAGYRVIGAAVKAEAARTLAAGAVLDADTVALLLATARTDPRLLDARTVVIVDEGSTLGDRDLAALLTLATRAGATLRILGDPAQHQSVPTGGCWSWLVTRQPTVELTTVHRLTDPGERARADAIRDGRISQAIAALVDSGQLELSDRDADTYAKMLTRWLDARNSGQPHPMVHGRNNERRILNALAQQLLIAAGDVDPALAVTLRDGRRLCVGDEVIARRGHRRIHPDGKPQAWLRNGTTGTITAVAHGATPDADRVEIATAAGTIGCDRRVFDRRNGGIDHSYAVTSYAVQGATHDLSTSAITSTTNRAELYVDATRGRHSNRLYGTRTQRLDDDADRHLPRLDRHLLDDVTANLARGTGTPAACADPTSARLASQQQRTLAALLAARRAGQEIDDGEVERTVAALRAGATIPAGFARIVPAAPAAPHLQRRIEALAGDVAVHHASHNPPRRRAATPLEHALGPRPSTPDGGASWDRLATQLVQIAAAVTTRQLSTRKPAISADLSTGDGWAPHYIHRLAAAGHLADVDLDNLANRLDHIDRWRRTHHIEGLDHGLLGARPDKPNAAFDYDRLTHSLTAADATIERSIA